MNGKQILSATLAAGLCLPFGSALGDPVREEGVKTIAGALGGDTGAGAAERAFKSAGNELLFATMDADIYRRRPGGDDHHAAVADGVEAAAGHEPGGCSGEDDEGGPGVFCLQVIDDTGGALCHAARPAPPPGWQRDPRLACVLPESQGQRDYAVRVALSDGHDSCSDPLVAGVHGQVHPFLLNLSLRSIAPSGAAVQQAVAQSGNRF